MNLAGEQDWGTERPDYTESEARRDELEEFEASTMQVPALHFASFFGSERATRVLLNGGSNVNEVDGMGGTAVHWTILGGCNEMLKFLMEAGADANINRKQMPFQR